jgi:hypothetical protein
MMGGCPCVAMLNTGRVVAKGNDSRRDSARPPSLSASSRRFKRGMRRGGARAAEGHERASRSDRPIDVQYPARLGVLAASAVRLCEAERSLIYRFDGQFLRVVAIHNVTPEIRTFVEQNPVAPGRRHRPRARHRQADRGDARWVYLGRIELGQGLDIPNGAPRPRPISEIAPKQAQLCRRRGLGKPAKACFAGSG